MRRRGRERAPDFKAEINVTSLVDVAFTLLVIFIITAPALQGGVEIEVPRANVRPITAQDDPFIVSVSRDGSIFIGETRVEREDFKSAFPQLVAAAGRDLVYIRGDSAAVYGIMAQVIGTVANSNVRFGLIMEPDRNR
jgi:biopolymer transport protein TolR